VAHRWIWLGNLRERDQWEHLSVDERITLNLVFKKWDGVGGLDYLAQDREKWWALVHKVMNFNVPQNAWNCLTS